MNSQEHALKRQQATTRYRRRELGAVMMETVLVMPFIMLALVLIVYLGWNFRRLAQVTNMDRYAVWESVTPGAPGPDTQGLEQPMRNPRLNKVFFELNSDQAVELDELHSTGNNRYLPEGHRVLRDQQTDEAYSYFNEFLNRNPRGNRQRFTSTHNQSVNTRLLDLTDFTRDRHGHSRMNGDWRYLNGIEYDSERDKWQPARPRVSPASSLREVFFAEFDDGLDSLSSDNEYATGVRQFYQSYPPYAGPEIDEDTQFRNFGSSAATNAPG